jgi:hypothetical protein
VGVDCYWCQACGDRYWTGNVIDLKVFMWVFHNRWSTQTIYTSITSSCRLYGENKYKCFTLWKTHVY